MTTNDDTNQDQADIPYGKNGIQNFISLSEVPDLAQLYFYSVLDCMSGLANIVSNDFVHRPQLYTDLDPNIIARIEKFYVQYGTELIVLSPKHRYEIFLSIFGKHGQENANHCGSFSSLRDNLFESCARYSANIRSAENQCSLLAEVKTSLIPFLNYLNGLQGNSVNWRLSRIREMNNDLVYPLLRNATVANVFSVQHSLSAEWPVLQVPSASILIENISKGKITRGHFSQLQEVALAGARAITCVIRCDEEISDQLISDCTRWRAARKYLHSSGCKIQCN